MIARYLRRVRAIVYLSRTIPLRESLYASARADYLRRAFGADAARRYLATMAAQ